MANIYLSSTFIDLKICREAVYQSLRRMRHDVIAMEDYVATDQRPQEKCLTDVANCNLYIGIIAWRYGYIPHEGNPENKSITELEYRKAIEVGKSRLIFLVDDDAPWPLKLTDMHTGESNSGALIKRFREELQQQELVSFFQSSEELAGLVSQAVHNWEVEHVSEIPQIAHHRDRIKYLENVGKRYGIVTLPLGPAEGFSLPAIFQPLTLRSDPLAAEDLERKKHRALLGESISDKSALILAELYLKRTSDAKKQPLNLEIGDIQASTLLFPELLEKKPSDEEQLSLAEEIAMNGEDAIKKSPYGRVVILGGPGTGKSTTLKYLIGCRAKEALIDPEAPMPIFLSLADLARSGKTLQRYLVDLVEDMATASSYAEVLWKEIEKGRAFICLDSLDEVDPQQRPRIIELINFWSSNAGCTWVIGSRFTEYKGGQFKQGQFTEWELLPMDHTLRLELAQRLLPEIQRLLSIDPAASPSPVVFVNILEQHLQASAWGENPLLFSLCAVVFVQTGGLPSSRSMLYREVIEAVLKTREQDHVWYKLLWHVLSDLALWLHQTRGRIFSMEDLLSFLMDIQRKSWKETADLAHRIVTSGVMEIVASNTYAFRHQTFQEYLSAIALARNLASQDPIAHEKARNLAWSKRTYSRWTEVLQLMVGALMQLNGGRGRSEAMRWLHTLGEQRNTLEGDPGNLGLALALRSLVEITEIPERGTVDTAKVEESIVLAWIDELFGAAKRYRDTKMERLITLAYDVRQLHGNGVDRALMQLVNAINDHDTNVQNVTMRVLCALKERVPSDPLIAALYSQDKYVRRIAIRVLRVQEAIMPLNSLFAALHDEDQYVSSVAAEILQIQGDHVPADSLCLALEDENRNVRLAAIETLKTRKEPIPLKFLFNAVNDVDWFVRSTAIEVLKKQTEHLPIQPLLAALTNEDNTVRRVIIQILGEQSKRVPIEALQEALNDKDESVRVFASEALAKRSLIMGAPHSRGVDVHQVSTQAPKEPHLMSLLADLHNVDESILQAALEGLEEYILSSLLAVLDSEDEGIRQTALETLVKDPLTLLLEDLHDKDEDIRQLALETLEKRLFKSLKLVLTEDVEAQLLAALHALGMQGEHVPLESLVASLYDKHEVLRETTVALLKKHPPKSLLATLYKEDENLRRVLKERPVKSLLAILSDEDENVRQAATEVLKERPVKSLLAILSDEDENVRQAAVEVLKTQSIQSLSAALHDEDENVRQAAVQIIGIQDERILLEFLFQTLQVEEREVYQLAVKVLSEQSTRIPLNLLLEGLKQRYWVIRQAAVEVLGTQGEQTATDLLLAALYDENKNVRHAAINALKVRGEHVAHELLQAATEKLEVHESVTSLSDDKSISEGLLNTIEALKIQEGQAPIKSLVTFLKNRDENVRQAAIDALKACRERVPLRPLLDILRENYKPAHQAVVEVLKSLGERVSLKPFIDALQSRDEYARLIALRVLEGQAERVPLDALLAALNDKNAAVRQAALRVIKARGEDVPLDSLLHTLYDENRNVRLTALEIVRKYREHVAIQQLVAILGDEDKDVRRLALQILQQKDPDSLLIVVPEAIKILRERIPDTILGSITQSFIADLIGNMKYSDPMLVETLAQLLDWPYWQVRMKAASALGEVRRNIPDTAIRRLLALRSDLEMPSRILCKGKVVKELLEKR